VYTFFTAALLRRVSNHHGQSQDTRAAVSISTEFGTSPVGCDVTQIASGKRVSLPESLRILWDPQQYVPWVDIASINLAQWFYRGHPYPPPRIVVVRTAADIALFWNLRMEYWPEDWLRILPVPEDQLLREDTPLTLGEWLKSVEEPLKRCELWSLGADQTILRATARRLRGRLRGLGCKVKVVSGTQDIPLVVGYESQVVRKAEFSENRCYLEAPRPKFLLGQRVLESWIVDLLGDADTKRSPKELCLPEKRCCVELLNAPYPPRWTRYAVPRVGYGIDSINILCSGNEEFLSWFAPSETEVLETVLYDAGIQLEKDEKRDAYVPVLRLWGNLAVAAAP